MRKYFAIFTALCLTVMAAYALQPLTSPLQVNSQPVLNVQYQTWAPSSNGIYPGQGNPNMQITAALGSIYTRGDGGLQSSLYLKGSGGGNTNWFALIPVQAYGVGTMTNGAVIVSNSYAATNAYFHLTTIAAGGTVGFPYISSRTSTNFTITSTSTNDASQIFWELVPNSP